MENKWLKSSGIRYRDGREMIDSLNPLDEVIETRKNPMARIYRTSVWRGIFDTYNVLVGSHYNFKNKNGQTRKGILDLLLFPVIARRLMYLAYRPTPKWYMKLLVIPAAVVGIPLEIIRGLLGIILTVPLSTVVVGIHTLTAYKGYQLRKRALSLRVSHVNLNTRIEQPEIFSKILAQHKKVGHFANVRCSISDLASFAGSYDIYEKKTLSDRSKAYICVTRFFKPKPISAEELKKALDTIEQKKALDAFEALNIGGPLKYTPKMK